MAVRIIAVLDVRGQGDKIIHLGTLSICNDGSEKRVTKGNYDVTQLSTALTKVKSGKVLDHPRKRKSIWNLVSKALTELGHDNE